MPAPNPQVSVFHFTSRISSAKIRKYKLATERGMTGTSDRNATSNITKSRPRSPPRRDEIPPAEPPAKKPRLKLHARPPSNSPDTIVVSRPKDETPLRMRYSDNMTIVEIVDVKNEQEPQAQPVASLAVPRKAPRTAKPKYAASTAPTPPTDYSKDFMSFYVTGTEADETEAVPCAPPEPPTKAAAATKAELPKQPMNSTPSLHQASQAARESRFQCHPVSKLSPQSIPLQGTKCQPPPTLPPTLPAQPQPIVQFIDDVPRRTASNRRSSVTSMIKKLAALNAALREFRGTSATASSPTKPSLHNPESSQYDGVDKLEKKKAEVDDFLAMFDEPDGVQANGHEEEGGDDTSVKDNAPDAPSKSQLNPSGEVDEALSFGVEFIQNALRSWAQQRSATQYTQYVQQIEHKTQHGLEEPRRDGPGRPKKLESEPTQIVMRPSEFPTRLSETKEGKTVAAFQQVLDAKCLKVNTILPAELSCALREVYMQIDDLINEGPKREAYWKKMPYNDQMEAAQAHLGNLDYAYVAGHLHMPRGHKASHHRHMQHSGTSAQEYYNTTGATGTSTYTVDVEHGHSSHNVPDLPQLSRYFVNPQSLDMNALRLSSDARLARLAKDGRLSSTSLATVPNADAVNGNPILSTSQLSRPLSTELRPQGSDKLNAYVPNLLSRSGQSMKFSFAPENELAVNVFGPQAFPSKSYGPQLPNRGPMSSHASGSPSPKELLERLPRTSQSSALRLNNSVQSSRPVKPVDSSQTLKLGSSKQQRSSTNGASGAASRNKSLNTASSPVVISSSPIIAASWPQRSDAATTIGFAIADGKA